MIVYNTATAGTAPNNVTPGIYYSDGTTWNRNEEIIATNGLTKNVETVKLGGTLTEHTTITQEGFNFILKPSATASGMTFAQGNNTSYNRIFMPTDGLEIQSNEVSDLTKPILKVMNTGVLGGEKFRIQSDGKVGIGTENNANDRVPTNLLHLFGGTTGAETVLLNLQANAGGTTIPGTGVSIRFSPTNPGGFNARGAEIAGVNQGANAINMIFRTTSASSNFMERMKIMSSGEVGINTNPTNIITGAIPSPTSMLHVNGTIAVTTGNTIANSIILSSSNIILPDATLSPGRIYIVRNTSASASITVSSIIGYTATTASVFTLSPTQGAITVVSNGTSWYRVQ
jgi:hypothetical protein